MTHGNGHHVALKQWYQIDRADEETIADSSAFVVMSRYGIDSATYSSPWGWGKHLQSVPPERLRVL